MAARNGRNPRLTDHAVHVLSLEIHAMKAKSEKRNVEKSDKPKANVMQLSAALAVAKPDAVRALVPHRAADEPQSDPEQHRKTHRRSFVIRTAGILPQGTQRQPEESTRCQWKCR